MKVAALIALLPFAAAGLVGRQDFQSAPQCAQDCIAQAALNASNQSGCDVTGTQTANAEVISCLCKDPNFLPDLATCFKSDCQNEDVTQVNGIIAQFCAPYIGNGTVLPPATSLAASASASSASASISAALSSASGAVNSAAASASGAIASIASSASSAIASVSASGSAKASSASSSASAASSSAAASPSPSGGAGAVGAQFGWVAGVGALAGILAL